MTPFMRDLILEYGLTVKEAEAADLVAQGFSRDKIKQRFGLSPQALQERMGGAYKKLGFKWPKEQLKDLYKLRAEHKSE